MIEADFHEVYGVDLGDADLLRARSLRWLKTRILGLLGTDSRLRRSYVPPEQDGIRRR